MCVSVCVVESSVRRMPNPNKHNTVDTARAQERRCRSGVVALLPFAQNSEELVGHSALPTIAAAHNEYTVECRM
jgi:hypothetical protein